MHGYDDFCGLPVLVESTSQDAVATIRNGQSVILVDPSVMSNWKLSRIFALAHECGHHKLGHLSAEEQFSRRHMNATGRQELQADCWAAKTLVKHGYYDDLRRTIILNELQGPQMVGAYPSGQVRSAYIAKCAGIAELEADIEDLNEDVGPSPVCLAEKDLRCMNSCQYEYGYSYAVCRNRMCNSPRQQKLNIERCSQ